jgi:hypothetical protein
LQNSSPSAGRGNNHGTRRNRFRTTDFARRNEFATVPDTDDADDWAGTPLAFIKSDFSFYSASGYLMDAAQAEHQREDVQYVSRPMAFR